MINYVNEDDLFSPTCPRATGARHTVNLHIPICNSLIGKVGLRPRSQLATRSNISSMQDKKKNIITIKKTPKNSVVVQPTEQQHKNFYYDR